MISLLGRQISALLFAALVVPTVHAAAPAVQCFERAKVNEHVTRFNIPVPTFHNPQFLCGEHRKQNHLLTLVESLEFINTISFDEMPKKKLSGLTPGHIKKPYYTHLASTVRSFAPSYEGECSQGWCAYASLHHWERVVRLSPSFFDRKVSDVLIRTGSLIHESRHAQGDGYRHVVCTRGTYKGLYGACDPSFSYAGSYAVETEYYARVYLYASKLDKKLRMLAREYALDRLRAKFNRFSPAAQGKELLLVAREDGTLAFFDGDGVSPASGPLRAGEIAFPTLSAPGKGKTMVPRFDILSGDRATARGSCLFRMDTKLGGCEGTTSSELVAALSEWPTARKASMKDLRDFGDDGAVVAFNNRIEVVRGPGLHPLPLPSPEFVDEVPGCDLQARGAQVLVKDASGSVSLISIGGIGPRIEKFNCRWPKGIKAYAELGRRRFALRDSGEVVEVQANGKTQAVPAFSGMRVSKMFKAAQRYFPELDARE